MRRWPSTTDGPPRDPRAATGTRGAMTGAAAAPHDLAPSKGPSAPAFWALHGPEPPPLLCATRERVAADDTYTLGTGPLIGPRRRAGNPIQKLQNLE